MTISYFRILLHLNRYPVIHHKVFNSQRKEGRPTEEQKKDRLFVEGIRSRGYGLIPKAVMLDPDLSASAKGLYAFFASFTGSGNTAFPGRDYILSSLDLCKDAYYRYLQELTSFDYIRIEKRKTQGKFDGNLYIIVDKPSRFRENLPVIGAEDCNRIRVEGLTSAGFGFIPKAVMLDKAISIKSKALYAYLSSFCGAGTTACPGKDIILYHLNIGKDAYAAALKSLRQQNYVTVTQKHSGGKLGNLEFTLVNKPDLLAAQLGNAPIQVSEKQDAVIQYPDFQDMVFVRPGIQDTVSERPDFEDTALEDTDFPDSKTNSKNINSFCKYPSYQQQKPQPLLTGVEEDRFNSIVFEFLSDYSDELCGNEILAQKLVKHLCNYQEMQKEHGSTCEYACLISRDFFFMFVDAMIALLSDPETVIARDKIPQARILWQLSRCVPRVESGALLNFCWEVEQEYQEAVRHTEPRFPRLFLKRMILNHLTEGNMRVKGEAIHDMAQSKFL